MKERRGPQIIGSSWLRETVKTMKLSLVKPNRTYPLDRRLFATIQSILTLADCADNVVVLIWVDNVCVNNINMAELDDPNQIEF